MPLDDLEPDAAPEPGAGGPSDRPRDHRAGDERGAVLVEFALVAGVKTASLHPGDPMPEDQVGFRVVFTKS